MGFSAGDVEARLVLDRTPFNDELRGARADADKFSREPITGKVDLDDAKAKAKVDDLKRKRADVKGSVDLDTRDAKAKLAELKKFSDQTVGAQFASKLSEAPAWLGPALVSLPAAMTVLGTATGAAVALGSSLATGGIAFATYGTVAKSVITKAATAASAVQAAQNRYNASITAGAKQSSAYLTEQKAINLAYAQMSPAQIALSKQLGDLSNEWSGVEKSLTPVISMSVQPWLSGITSAARFAKPVVTDVSQAVSSLGTTFDALVNLPAFGTFAKFIGSEGTDVIASGGGALMNFFHGFIILLPQVKPLIDDVDNSVARLGSSFLTWSEGDSARHDIQAFMAWLAANGPTVGHLLLSIGGALKNVGSGLLEGPAGADEIRLLTGFFGYIERLPPGFVQPVSDLAASLLLISKFGFGRKVISIGLNIAGTAAAKLWNLLTPGGSIDLTGKFSGAAGMQAAADTMVAAARAMQAAADTMVGGNVHGGAPVVTGGKTAAAEGGTAAEGVEAGSAESAGIVGALLAGARGLLIANPGLWGLAVSGDSGPRTGPSPTSPAGLGLKPGQTAVENLMSGPDPMSKSEAEKVVSLSVAGNTSALSAMGLDPKVIAQIVRFTAASTAAAKAVSMLGSAEFAGKVPSTQFAGFLTAAGTSGLKAKTLTDEYTLAIQRNGTTSQAAQQIRSQMIADFEHQGLSAQQANKLVDTYTDTVAANGNTIAAKAKVRAQLISDFENAGLTAKAAAAKVDTLIGQIANVHSKSVSLTVRADGSFTIREGQVTGPGGTRINAGPGTPGSAAGGLITGPGTGTSDTAGLYRLSNKEYVQTADAVNHYGVAFMDAVRAKQIPRMAGGGLAGTFTGSPAGLGAFDARQWRATQSMVESADAAAAASALRKSIAAARAQIMGGLGNATGTPLQILKYAQSFLGTPYVWGGTTPGGWDCSGYTDWVYHHFGIPAPRTSQEQQLWAQPSGDQPAALVFFYGTGGTASHVGLSIGNGTMMNAADPALGTLISSTAGNSGFGVPPNASTGQRGAGPGLSPRIFDYAGWLPPGLTLVDNRTGSPELLHRSRTGGMQQGVNLDQVPALLARIIGAIYEAAGMTADGVASAIGSAAGKEAVRAAYSPRW